DAADHSCVREGDERLSLAAARQRVPHRATCGEHRGRGVDCIAALGEDQCAGGCGERLAGNCEPVSGVERRLFRLRVAWIFGLAWLCSSRPCSALCVGCEWYEREQGSG